MKYCKGSFITVPSKTLLEGLNPIAQCLFMWLCSFANETGDCFPSRATLATKVGCSDKTIDRMLELLIEKGLVRKENRVKNNEKQTNLYSVIIGEGTPTRSLPTPTASLRVPPQSRIELNPVLTQSNTSESEIRVVPEEKETEPRSKTKPKYPKARTAFSWFPRVEPSWSLNTTELKHGELLFLRGERQVKTALRFVNEHKGEEYFPTVTKPSDLERKWKDIVSKQKK